MVNSSASNTSQGCPMAIDEMLFDLGCLGPALLIIFVLASFKRRVKFKLENCNGYPGLVTPFNYLGGFSNRFTIAVAFGATANTCLDQLFLHDSKNGLFQETDLAGWEKIFQGIVTVLVYGILFYPFFACLTTENRLIGSLLGFLYVTIRFSFKLGVEFQCVKYNKGKYQKEKFSLGYLGLVPINLCLAFIWIRFGVLLYRAVRKKWFSAEIRDGDEIRDTRLARETEVAHMKELLNPGSILDNAVELNWYPRLLHCFYKPRKDFKFSTQFISTMLVSGLTTFQILMKALSWLDPVRRIAIQSHRDAGYTRLANLSDIILGGVEAGLVLSAVFSILMQVHFMKCHREHVLQLYRGQTTFCQDVSLTPSALVGKSLRFSGYQIAFTLIGFVTLSLCLSAVAIVLAILFKGPKEVLGPEIWGHLKDALYASIPTLALAIFLLLFQLFLAHFVFRDATYPNITVTIDNRRLFSIMSYFFFFYNIILGLVSCTIRILKGMLLGVMFISRIDRTSLMQGYQAWDKAFVAYLGFVTVLVAHRHPVMLVFCQLLMNSIKGHQAPQERPMCKPVYHTFGPETGHHGGTGQELGRPRMSQKAFNRWFLAVTLMRNPSLVNYRSRGRHVTASVVNLESVNFGVPV